MASVSGDDKKESELKLKLKLYSHWRSSCSFRVLIALNLKGLEYEYKAVNLEKGEQFSPVFRRKVPPPPSIVASGSSQKSHQFPGSGSSPISLKMRVSTSCLRYSFHESKHAANIVSSSIQPFQNIATLKCIEEKISSDPDVKLAWPQHYIKKGFVALERLLKDYAGRFATGDEIYLVWFPASSVSVPANLYTVCKHLKSQGFGNFYQRFTAVTNAFPIFSIYIECTRCLTINT
uniref:GST N-terminal domain-containing protein n=1 Tax=Quercus lobata TaxID=97700 RepID=A0A7N2M1F7_QUELO